MKHQAPPGAPRLVEVRSPRSAALTLGLVRQMMPVRILVTFLFCAIASRAVAQDKAEPKRISVPYTTDPAKPLDIKDEIVNQADDHTQYRVEFNGIKGDRVPAYLYIPKRKADAPPLPAILLQYGSGGNKKTNYIVKICNALQCRGVGD